MTVFVEFSSVEDRDKMWIENPLISFPFKFSKPVVTNENYDSTNEISMLKILEVVFQ